MRRGEERVPPGGIGERLDHAADERDIRLADAHAGMTGRTYMYEFAWPAPGLGAVHALEIPFVFGTLTTPGVERFTGSGPEALALSEKMQDAWLAFAKTGNPSTEALEEAQQGWAAALPEQMDQLGEVVRDPAI